jgi:hypothetical protein
MSRMNLPPSSWTSSVGLHPDGQEAAKDSRRRFQTNKAVQKPASFPTLCGCYRLRGPCDGDHGPKFEETAAEPILVLLAPKGAQPHGSARRLADSPFRQPRALVQVGKTLYDRQAPTPHSKKQWSSTERPSRSLERIACVLPRQGD